MGRPKGKSKTYTNVAGKEESASGWFRNVFNTHRRYLKQRSNEAVLKLWLDDHPQYNTVPGNVKQGLANVKGAMRSKMHKRRSKDDIAAGGTATAIATPKKSAY